MNEKLWLSSRTISKYSFIFVPLKKKRKGLHFKTKYIFSDGPIVFVHTFKDKISSM